MGSKRNVDMSANTDKITVLAPQTSLVDSQAAGSQVGAQQAGVAGNEGDAASSDGAQAAAAAPAEKKHARSSKYQSVRSRLDRTKRYSIEQAVGLVQELSYSSFDGTITADGVVKEVGALGTLTFPHTTGKSRTIAIVDDALLEKIGNNEIDFDVLIASPEYMPKLAKHARVLGPRGLMPNPKNGTLTSKPEDKKKELEAGAITIKTEKKRPVIHVTVGKVSLESEKIVENIQALIKLAGPKLSKLTLSATMSPGVRVEL